MVVRADPVNSDRWGDPLARAVKVRDRLKPAATAARGGTGGTVALVAAGPEATRSASLTLVCCPVD